MPKAAPPNTPFSTPLSGSAKEAEERIRNIFQYKKTRPPLPLFLAACVLALFCGGLVSCQTGENAASSQMMEEGAVWDTLRRSADVSGLDDRDGLAYTMLASVSGEDYTLAALSVHDFYPRYTLVIGAADTQTGELLGPVFQTSGYGSLPTCTAISQYGGAPALLYTANGMHLGLSWGEAGLVSWDGEDLDWAWPVEGDLRDESSHAYASYNAYWEDHLALLAPRAPRRGAPVDGGPQRNLLHPGGGGPAHPHPLPDPGVGGELHPGQPQYPERRQPLRPVPHRIHHPGGPRPWPAGGGLPLLHAGLLRRRG